MDSSDKTNAQTIKDSFENFLINSEMKPNLIETDRGKEFYYNFFQNFLNNNNIKHYSRNTYLGAAFSEKFKRTITDLLKRAIFDRGNAGWIDVLLVITRQNINKIHTSINFLPIQSCLKKNGAFV